MNWDAVAAISGLLATVAVVVSVIYLAIEIRRNTTAAMSQTHYLATTALAETGATIASDKDLSRVYRLGLSAPEELDEDEYFRFALIGTSQFRSFENLFFQRNSGLVTDQFWAGHRENILWFFHRPGMQIWWAEKRLAFSADFREFLEASALGDLASPEARRV